MSDQTPQDSFTANQNLGVIGIINDGVVDEGIGGGSGGNTEIFGDGNNNVLHGTGEADLYGGAGADDFFISIQNHQEGTASSNDVSDHIRDFEVGVDLFQITGETSGFQLTSIIVTGSTVTLYASGNRLLEITKTGNAGWSLDDLAVLFGNQANLFSGTPTFLDGQQVTLQLMQMLASPGDGLVGLVEVDLNPDPQPYDISILLELDNGVQIQQDSLDENVVLHGQATYDADGGQNDTGAIQLDGSVGTYATVEDLEVGDQLTMSIWARFDDHASHSYARLIDTGSANGSVIRLYQDSTTDNIKASILDGDGNYVAYLMVEDQIVDGEWAHWTLSVSDNAMTLYKNGVEVGVDTTLNGSLADDDYSGIVVLGAREANGGNRMKGAVSDFEVSNEALNAEQVSDLYDATANPTTVLNDVTGAGVDLLLQSGVAMKTTGGPGGQTWLDFDGSVNAAATMESFKIGGLTTFATWVKFDDIGADNDRVFDFGDAVRDNWLLLKKQGTTDDLRLYATDENGVVTIDVTAEDVIVEGAWMHLAVTVDEENDRIEFYANGTSVHESEWTGSLSADVRSDMRVGESLKDNYNLDGGIADFTVIDHAIHDDMAADLYQAALNDDYDSLVFVA